MCRERDEMFYRVYDESRECGAETQLCVREERTLICAEGCTLTDAVCGELSAGCPARCGEPRRPAC